MPFAFCLALGLAFLDRAPAIVILGALPCLLGVPGGAYAASGFALGALACYLVMRFKEEPPAKQAADMAYLTALEQKAEAIASSAAAKAVSVTQAAHTEAVKALTAKIGAS